LYTFFAEGYGEYTFYLHFYPEAPVLGAVFYAGLANNKMNFAGTYTVEKKDKEYACYPDRDSSIVPDSTPPKGVAPYTVTFYDFAGNEIESCGFDGDILYNDLTKIAGSGSSPLYYHHDIDPNSKYNSTYEAEAGVKYLEFFSPDDDTATVTLYHNQTYTDLMTMMIEGSWAMKDGANGGYDYTLTPNDNTDTGAVLAVSADTKTATYTPDGGEAQNVVTTAKSDTPSGVVETLFSFTGGFTTLDILTDGTYKFAFESSNVEEKGTWTFDKTTYQFSLTQENDNVITAAIDGTSHDLTLHYVAVINEQLKDDFSAPSSDWSVLTTFEVIIPTVETLFSFTGGFTTLDILTDGTYKFEFPGSATEFGTWEFDKAAYQLTLTQENGNVLTAAIEGDAHDMKLHYAVINSQLADDFTVGSDIWGPALTQ
jgi:hypothetical protein